MKSHKKLRWSLSLEPGYQLIYWSLCWLSFFIGLIAWLEFTFFNWVTVLFWLISLLFIFTAKKHYLFLENDHLVFSSLFKKKKLLPLHSVAKITYTPGRLVVLNSHEDMKIARFYLKAKSRNHFLMIISTHYPDISIQENAQPLEE